MKGVGKALALAALGASGCLQFSDTMLVVRINEAGAFVAGTHYVLEVFDSTGARLLGQDDYEVSAGSSVVRDGANGACLPVAVRGLAPGARTTLRLRVSARYASAPPVWNWRVVDVTQGQLLQVRADLGASQVAAMTPGNVQASCYTESSCAEPWCFCNADRSRCASRALSLETGTNGAGARGVSCRDPATLPMQSSAVNSTAVNSWGCFVSDDAGSH